MARNALKDTLVLHLAMLARQCVLEEDAPRMRKVCDALQERCATLGASYEAVLRELDLPRPLRPGPPTGALPSRSEPETGAEVINLQGQG